MFQYPGLLVNLHNRCNVTTVWQFILLFTEAEAQRLALVVQAYRDSQSSAGVVLDRQYSTRGAASRLFSPRSTYRAGLDENNFS